jgi:tRNA A-37 threonylcarbamoyl transferase component Bud32
MERLLQEPMQQLTLDRRSGVAILSLQRNYYVKTFAGRGSRIKDWLHISRYRREVRNLEFFAAIGLRTPEVVARGHEYRAGLLRRAMLVTAEVTNAIDLEELIRRGDLYEHGVAGARLILAQVAMAARELHARGFYHKDLKTRNILVKGTGSGPELFFFDCPSGHHPPSFMLRRGIVRDLAHLEEGLRGHVRKVDLLYLYKQYRGCDKLSAEDKALARDALSYYARRRMTRKRRLRAERKKARSQHRAS